ncbi:MAG: PHB depolymerase family esterase [Bacteroidota bacterium]|nr:PHB depolymerase family esterase [Bacteroidota bacterium]
MRRMINIMLFVPLIGLSQQQSLESINYDGNDREYIIYIPQSYSVNNPVPVLLAFHGGSGFADDFMNNEADFRSISDTAGFILVYPQALEDPNDGNSTNWLHKDPTDHKDIFFVEALIDDISTNYSIDTERIYACGYSLGGMFSYELACQLNNKITAISSVAGAAFFGAFSSCDIYHPTAVQSINGTEDGTHPYDDQNGWGYFSVAAIDSFWAVNNNTDALPIITPIPDINTADGSSVERYSWINGDGCVSVEELKITGGGHDWPSPLSPFTNQDINATSEVWNFVSKYNMNGLIECDTISTSISSLTLPKVSLQPNPSNGTFTVHSTQSILQIEVYNLLGKQVASEVGQGRNLALSMVQPTGLYFVKVLHNEGDVTLPYLLE